MVSFLASVEVEQVVSKIEEREVLLKEVVLKEVVLKKVVVSMFLIVVLLSQMNSSVVSFHLH